MRTGLTITSLALALGLAAGAAPAAAQPAPARDRGSAFGGLGANKEPINIDADRLDVFDKESRAVFAGNVVAVQGDTTMKCTTLTVFYEQNRQAGGRPAASATQGAGDNAIKKIDCKGPVTIVSKTQVATGDNATFDRVANRVFLLGNVALTDGPNVTRGERIVYDLNSGVANVETAPGGRVKALFVPGSNPEAAAAGGGAKTNEARAGEAKPGDARAKPPRPATN
ncbi:MAG TPA: LptA/OstA family protein [Microvirga sp.]|nr:LptA/OstA family protein [Microvirga sp.]